jgi:hypothetical protein
MKQWQLVLALLFFAKMLLTTLNRGVYPFAEYFAEGLQVSRSTFFFVLSAGEFMGFLAPLFGTAFFNCFQFFERRGVEVPADRPWTRLNTCVVRVHALLCVCSLQRNWGTTTARCACWSARPCWPRF